MEIGKRLKQEMILLLSYTKLKFEGSITLIINSA
jgi:hypothetical protein